MRNDFLINTESGCILLEDLAVKSSNGNRISQRGFVGSGDRITSNISHADTIARTQKLLDRAIAYAWHTVKSDRRPPKLTPIRWVWRLAGAYHSSCHTTRLMEEAAGRFAASGRQNLAQWAAQKAKEEAGHDRLALLDIQSMGYDAEAVVKALVPPTVKTLINYFIQSVQTTDPIDCVGFFYTSERLGIFQGEEYIQSVQALLPPGTHATRWLRIHSGVGAEVKHVEETVEVVAHLTCKELIRIAKASYETALLRFTPPKEDYISDEELQNVLKPLELQQIST
ncbi:MULTISPECIES: hypothetical protein [Nostoc]|uniref:Uncharacterized protein n=2 Tax=Nostoc TaxID=1177 RepID=A0ABR8IAM3_9NOSO|nr:MULTISPECIES: hypothetical protein [Nostoc]MBD2562175.1 hypothetical protein [Nostoc linckia FACHB-391]MBD2647575.1 hypothetical protein [Nostoc foliaceum FACHB-393]